MNVPFAIQVLHNQNFWANMLKNVKGSPLIHKLIREAKVYQKFKERMKIPRKLKKPFKVVTVILVMRRATMRSFFLANIAPNCLITVVT